MELQTENGRRISLHLATKTRAGSADCLHARLAFSTETHLVLRSMRVLGGNNFSCKVYR